MPSVEPDSEQSESGKVSDQEWEIRTGRAIYILQQTLPEFFETGLVSSLDHSLDDHASSSKAWSLPNPTDTWHSIKGKLSPTSKSPRESEEVNEAPSIYSPRIHLTYTPPVPLPAPLPKTLHTEGLHLYIASSIFVRHTLNALYTDLAVEIKRVRVTNGGPTQGSLLSLPQPSPSRRQRDKSISFGLGVSGVGRVSGARTEWEINCTYIFSPLTGLIVHHSVDSIEPAPHQGLFEALGKFGLLEAGIGPRTGGVGS
ncbi:hypothetical protein BDW22DRAFT_1361903 [Trametopsis cervina]|nr:hypothetical protein BDW22DRAFT_1361903 [Trametopsis cervina]